MRNHGRGPTGRSREPPNVPHEDTSRDSGYARRESGHGSRPGQIMDQRTVHAPAKIMQQDPQYTRHLSEQTTAQDGRSRRQVRQDQPKTQRQPGPQDHSDEPRVRRSSLHEKPYANTRPMDFSHQQTERTSSRPRVRPHEKSLSRPRDNPRSMADPPDSLDVLEKPTRHAPQLSISDDSHHVTEVLGELYGDMSETTMPERRQKHVDRPLSFVSSPPLTSPSRKTLSPRRSLHRQHSSSDTANTHFPLNDIDYESNPNAIAQELHNLTALRRMSMDVNASGDPDLPSFSSNFANPPTGGDPDDAARLYWVPASVHPELAPMEFETFLEKKVKSLKRRSEEQADEKSATDLRRRKSMLSRQIDNTDGRGGENYQDGAERLDHRRSNRRTSMLGVDNLQDLGTMVNEPDKILQRLSLEAQGREEGGNEDMPILPPALSSNNSLKRSTRTTYRRGGSVRREERSKRAVESRSEVESNRSETPTDSKSKRAGIAPGMGPTLNLEDRQPRPFVSQIASNGRLGVPLEKPLVPQIIESPPTEYQPPERTSSHQRDTRTTLNDMSAHPQALPGNNTRTDSLSFIPTLSEERKAEGKKKKEEVPRKSSWSWGALLGNEETKEVKKGKMKPKEKGHDDTRLDVLQGTVEGSVSRGRESLILDRGDSRLEEERKKESARKVNASEATKKESGFFSTLLGGKKKGDREPGGKKHFARTLSPDPPLKILKPDIDYNWTRFSILEERAIYRMAHIKLANPRRELQSQVLLSNFMYSYLAKVQQMHPQANIPQRGQASKKDQPEEFAQYQRYQEQQERQEETKQGGDYEYSASPSYQNMGDLNYDYGSSDEHHGTNPSPNLSSMSGHSQMYGDAFANRNQPLGLRNHDPGGQAPIYAYQQGQFDDPDRGTDDDDMW